MTVVSGYWITLRTLCLHKFRYERSGLTVIVFRVSTGRLNCWGCVTVDFMSCNSPAVGGFGGSSFWFCCFPLRIVVSAVLGRWFPASLAPEVHLLLRGAASPPGVQALAGAAAAVAAATARGRPTAPVLARKGHVHSHRPFRIKFRLHRTERDTLKEDEEEREGEIRATERKERMHFPRLFRHQIILDARTHTHTHTHEYFKLTYWLIDLLFFCLPFTEGRPHLFTLQPSKKERKKREHLKYWRFRFE